jgi:predicted AlkP superfamily phosphohydrolase/phosphomutase
LARVVVVILEGISIELVERWMAASALPALSMLMQNGASGPFLSLPVPYEPPALLSCLTGVWPGDHGCFSFWHTHNGNCGGVPRIVLSSDIDTPFIWEMPEAASLQVGIVNIFGTHPPKQANGNLISYPLQPTLHACYPPDLLLKLSHSGIQYGHDVSALYTGIPRTKFIELVTRVENARIHTCMTLMERDADLFVFNITIIDRLSHFWWAEVEKGSGIADNDTALWQAYRLADQFISQVVARLQSDDHLIVFSEIGFGPLRSYVSINHILQKAGLLAINDGQINASRTIAIEAVQGSHGINLNLKRRYGDGIVSAQEEEKRRQDVSEALLASTNPDTQKPLFKEVICGQKLYPGNRASNAPDLIVIPDDERYLPFGNPYWAKKVHRHLQTGWHRRESVWFGLGPQFKHQMNDTKFCCLDIAHAIADCLNLPRIGSHNYSLASRASS